MTMDLAPAGGGKLDIGQVIGGTVKVIGRNLVTFGILGFLLAGLPTAVMGVVQVQWLRGVDMTDPGVFFSAGYFTRAGYGGLVALITSLILQGALIHATVQDANGRKASVGDALATGLRNFLPLLGVGILFGLAIAVGFVFLIVPGVMLACAWCVASPALVVDRTGVFGAFRRAADLTRGNRWRIFGLAILLWIILLIVGAIFGAVVAAVLFTTPGALQDPVAAATNPLNILLQVVQQTVGAIIGAALISVLYVELRRLRDGAGPQWLADIFS